MNEKVLIVEDEFIIANDLRMILEKAGYMVTGIAASVEAAQRSIEQRRPDLVLLDIQLNGPLTGIDLAKELKRSHIAFVYLSANSNQQVLEDAKTTEPYGFLVKPFRVKDVLITLDIARYRHEHGLESRLHREVLLQEALGSISRETIGGEQKLGKMAATLQPYLPFDYMTVMLGNTDRPGWQWCSFFRTGFDQYQFIGPSELSNISGLQATDLQDLLNNFSTLEETAIYCNEVEFRALCRQQPLYDLLARKFNLASTLSMPFLLTDGRVQLTFFSRKPIAYQGEQLEMLGRLESSITTLIQNAFAEKVESQSVPTKRFPDAASHPDFSGIIGNSPALLNVLDLVAQVAPHNTSVLILGESGTGKERIASCIHQLSPRRNKALIKVNCAALPANLIESELFGHEKGAFTGAVDRRIGKFEQADGGTIFLDEIGEMPLDLQVKLLRVLQEKEIERLGGKAPVKVNVRIVAATNRNLEKEVAEHRFRLDLYYRLNVFPIYSPPLRERKEDIRLLANYFAAQCCERIKKEFRGISGQMLQELENYSWPGNIRELENIVEQSVILNDGQSELTLRRPLRSILFSTGHFPESQDQSLPVKTLSDVKQQQAQTERDYLLSVLKKAHGRIRGDGGAAELLKMKPTTLESRMAKLGIKKEDIA